MKSETLKDQSSLARRLASVVVAALLFLGVTTAVTVGPEIVGDPAPAAAEVHGNYWWGHSTWYSINDVKWQADYWKVISVAKKACNAMPHWVAKAACKNTVERYTNWIYDGWQTAKNEGKCLQINMLWTGQVIKVRPYSCNWY